MRPKVLVTNFFAQHRIHLEFASREASRQMSDSRVSGEARMQRIARFLVKYPKLVWMYDRGSSWERVVDVSRTLNGLRADDPEDPPVEDSGREACSAARTEVGNFSPIF